MNIPFRKLHGAGNDFIVMKIEDLPQGTALDQLAAKVCHRRFGIGADGLLVVAPSQRAAIKMIYYNSDGSLANMCGNGIRCFGKYVYDQGLVKAEEFMVETMAGVLSLKLIIEEGKVSGAVVNMGKLDFHPPHIPMNTPKETYINETLQVLDREFKLTSLLMQVPHTVIFVEELTDELVKTYGPVIQTHPQYPQGTNVNFAQIINPQLIHVKTWERGAGQTYACGTGVTSVCGVAHYLGLGDARITVKTDGGTLIIDHLPDGALAMTGPAEEICHGNFFYENEIK